jgi:hypothetical protein
MDILNLAAEADIKTVSETFSGVGCIDHLWPYFIWGKF